MNDAAANLRRERRKVRDRRLTFRLIRQALLRSWWRLGAVTAALLALLAASIAIGIYADAMLPVMAAILATVPATWRLPEPADKNATGWSAGQVWIAAFFLVASSMIVPATIGSYADLRRAEACLRVASIVLQGEQARATTRTIRCRTPAAR